jgi:hypothetical protein
MDPDYPGTEQQVRDEEQVRVEARLKRIVLKKMSLKLGPERFVTPLAQAVYHGNTRRAAQLLRAGARLIPLSDYLPLVDNLDTFRFIHQCSLCLALCSASYRATSPLARLPTDLVRLLCDYLV